MNKKFTVEHLSDKATGNGNIIAKLVNKSTVSISGLGSKTKSETYYIAVRSEELTAKVGDVIELELDMFEVIERPFELPDGSGEVQLKWLHLK